jgi:hypothetical protein
MTGNPSTDVAAAPCSGPQQAAAHHCAEAGRLAEAARLATEDLRVARRQRAEINHDLDGDARLGDRRALADAKAQAHSTYKTEYEHARDGGQVMVATAAWMADVSRLNGGARRAARDADGLAARQSEIGSVIERLELAADAARIAAASARQSCLDARRILAACEEAHDALIRPAQPSPASATAGAVPMASPERAPHVASPLVPSGEPAVVALLRGDRRMLQAVVSRLAEEIGHDAGRLQLLMLDLRDAIIASGRTACIFDFPPRHPFWGQFSTAEARSVASALATLGRRFDGHDGWDNGLVALPREMAMAMSLAGRDPRSVRRHPTPAELETLWQGTSVGAAEFVLSNAPDLRLEALIDLLGPRADALAELWDNWGRLRPLLLGHDGN